ncbi:MAG: 4-coumarate--CoA ligase family protein, partial [Pyrinomonadaceae bacterium]
DVTIPEAAFTPFVLQRAEKIAGKTALIDGATGRRVSYGELVSDIHRVAANLSARGFRQGDVFAIYSFNLPEYVTIFHAVSLLGGTNTLINPLYTTEEVANQLKDSGAKYLITVPQLLDKALEAAKKANVREVFRFGAAEDEETAGEATAFDALLTGEATDVPRVEINAREDIVALPYSSGTTGLPKGVMLTHHNLVANLLQCEALNFVSETDTLICVLPLFHIYGLMVIMSLGLYHGCTLVTMPRFELEKFLNNLQEHRVTMAHVVPPIILALSKHPIVDSYDLSSLHTIFSGAAPLGDSLISECTTRLGCHIRQGYGMTETSPVTHASPHDPAECKSGSIGTLAPNTQCKLVDHATGEEVTSHKREGEIWIRGPQVMKGYLNRPDATAHTLDEDGWLHTGDIGYADEDGHFFIVDRVKELIKYKGFQVAPAELEAVLLSHPQIADAAVIPKRDEEAGEVPKAFIVLKSPVAMEEIMAFVAERVAPHKKIRHLEVIEQIPKSASGKILRRVLVERERAKDKE